MWNYWNLIFFSITERVNKEREEQNHLLTILNILIDKIKLMNFTITALHINHVHGNIKILLKSNLNCNDIQTASPKPFYVEGKCIVLLLHFRGEKKISDYGHKSINSVIFCFLHSSFDSRGTYPKARLFFYCYLHSLIYSKFGRQLLFYPKNFTHFLNFHNF